MQMAEKVCVLTLLQKGDSGIAVARDIGVSKEAFFQLKRSAALSPPGMIPKRKACSGAPEKTSPRTNKLLKHEIPSYSSATAVELKKTNTTAFFSTSQPRQFVIDSRRILIYQVAVQPTSSCSLPQ